MKDQLIFNTDTVDTIAASDSVGAYLRSSDGTLLTHTTEGAKEALDVYIAGGASIEVDLDHTEDSVRLGNGVDFFTSTTIGADIGLDVNLINASIEVTATDLDIRDLSNATDSITAHQGGTWTIDSITNPVSVSQDGVWNVTVDNPFDGVVTATDLDIRDLDHSTDSVSSRLFDAAGAGLTSTLVGADQALDVNIVNEISVEDVALADASIAAAAKGTVGAVVASPLADRKYLYVYNQGNQKIYLGPVGVTSASGFPVSPGSYIEFRAGSAVSIDFAQNAGTIDVRSLELA